MKTLLDFRWITLLVLWGGLSAGRAEVGVQFLTNKPPALRFELFKVGPRTYTNLVVTARTDSDVFIRHQTGIGNFKVDELSAEQLAQLGYEAPKQKPTADALEAASKVTQEVMDRFSTPETHQKLTEFAQLVKARVAGEGSTNSPIGAEAGPLGPLGPISVEQLREIIPNSVLMVLTAFLVALPILYFFFCYTAKLVCKKAGFDPGFMIWLPLTCLIQLMRAARLSPWLTLLWFIPIANLAIMIVWSFKIVEARGKGLLTTLSMIFPPTAPFGWIYLAYSK